MENKDNLFNENPTKNIFGLIEFSDVPVSPIFGTGANNGPTKDSQILQNSFHSADRQHIPTRLEKPCDKIDNSFLSPFFFNKLFNTDLNESLLQVSKDDLTDEGSHRKLSKSNFNDTVLNFLFKRKESEEKVAFNSEVNSVDSNVEEREITSVLNFSQSCIMDSKCQCSNLVETKVTDVVTPPEENLDSKTIGIECSSPNLNASNPFIIHMDWSCVVPSGRAQTRPSSDNASISTIGPICRICHEGNEREKFLSPCQCLGTMALIHKKCLEKWLSTSNEENCELCRAAFHVKKTPKSFFKFVSENEDSYQQRAFFSDLACFLILTPLIFMAVYLCIMGAVHFKYEEKNQPFFNPPNRKFMDWPFRVGNFSSYLNKYRNSSVVTSVLQDVDAETKLMLKVAEFSALIALVVVLLCIYLAWLIIAVRYHHHAWLTWRATHQDVVLLEPNKPNSRYPSRDACTLL